MGAGWPPRVEIFSATNNAAQVWDAATGRERFHLSHEDPVNDITFSPDGEWIATASDNNTVPHLGPYDWPRALQIGAPGPREQCCLQRGWQVASHGALI